MFLQSRLASYTIITLCMLVCAASLGGWAYFFYGTYTERDTLAHALADRETANAKADYAETLHTLVRQTNDERSVLTTYSQMDALDLVQMIQDAADSAGVAAAVDTVSPVFIDSGTVKKVPALAIQISGRDSFTKLYTLLTLLETLPVPHRIDQVSFENEAGIGSSNTWTFLARISVFTEAAH